MTTNTPPIDTCIFCKIIKGDAQCFKIYENEHLIAFMDIYPYTRGHVLLVYKGHYETLFDMPETPAFSSISEVARAQKHIAEAIQKTVSADGMNVLQNNYPVSGQEVPHYHVHLIPRFKNDPTPLKDLERSPTNMEEIKQLALEITQNL